jgi:hypothetical protein
MVGLLGLLVPALMPAMTDGVRAIIGKFTGSAGAQPQNVAETIQLMEAQTKRVQALAALDQMPDGASLWVKDLRGSFRYVITGSAVLGAVVGTWVHVDPVMLAMLYDLAGSSMSFIIGERMYMNLRGAAK